MGDLSLVEWIVYGLFAYSGPLILMLSVTKDSSPTKSQSVIRTIWMIPSVIANAFLASSGINIMFPASTEVIKTFTINGTTGALLTNSTTINSISNPNVLINPVWMTFHLMLMLVMVTFVLTQLLSLFFKKD